MRSTKPPRYPRAGGRLRDLRLYDILKPFHTAFTEPEQLQLKAVRAHYPEIDALARHIRCFATMLTERRASACRTGSTPSDRTTSSLHTLDAVIAGLALVWNSGAVEGHIIRIKMLKRQMLERTGFALLQKRVLLS
ncbi:hypothetical protein ABTX77_42525 [Streptomyces sp. NPDC097704]|uniref:hypothetical protein n=1 Tax=Streptomyces sp. NPDC097704 TaxID=3157101 RepID=UPI003322DB8F